VPQGYTSQDFSTLLLEKAGIVCTPGNGFGDSGEGYVRMALTVSKERMGEVVKRLRKIL
jgi:LL-diaminopimelate aminotransferase